MSQIYRKHSIKGGHEDDFGGASGMPTLMLSGAWTCPLKCPPITLIHLFDHFLLSCKHSARFGGDNSAQSRQRLYFRVAFCLML